MICITIYTDASLCPETEVGSWACWIKAAPGETALHSGAFKTSVKCSTEAELMAIANALVVVKKTLAPRNAFLVVVTDSLIAIRCIAGERTRNKRTKKQRERMDYLCSLGAKIRGLVPDTCELRVNKVKAHTNKDGRRSYINNMVDKAARKAMVEKRKERAAQ